MGGTVPELNEPANQLDKAQRQYWSRKVRTEYFTALKREVGPWEDKKRWLRVLDNGMRPWASFWEVRLANYSVGSQRWKG